MAEGWRTLVQPRLLINSSGGPEKKLKEAVHQICLDQNHYHICKSSMSFILMSKCVGQNIGPNL